MSNLSPRSRQSRRSNRSLSRRS